MRVAVYTIAKDEQEHVQRWAAMASEADCRLILDTGSSDGTVTEARAAGVEVREAKFDPWRFDDARNAALALLPGDVDACLVVDMDEVLDPGWRDAIEATWAAGVTFPPVLVDTGRETYHHTRCHPRFGMRWTYPVHEVMGPVTGRSVNRGSTGQPTVVLRCAPLEGTGGTHASYLPLLEAAWLEYRDSRTAFYLARERMFAGDKAGAAAMFGTYLGLATWRDERAEAFRFLARVDPADEERWLLAACAEAPWRREPWVDFAGFRRREGDEAGTRAAVERALRLRVKPLEFFCEATAWDDDYVQGLLLA